MREVNFLAGLKLFIVEETVAKSQKREEGECECDVQEEVRRLGKKER